MAQKDLMKYLDIVDDEKRREELAKLAYELQQDSEHYKYAEVLNIELHTVADATRQFQVRDKNGNFHPIAIEDIKPGVVLYTGCEIDTIDKTRYSYDLQYQEHVNTYYENYENDKLNKLGKVENVAYDGNEIIMTIRDKGMISSIDFPEELINVKVTAHRQALEATQREQDYKELVALASTVLGNDHEALRRFVTHANNDNIERSKLTLELIKQLDEEKELHDVRVHLETMCATPEERKAVLENVMVYNSRGFALAQNVLEDKWSEEIQEEINQRIDVENQEAFIAEKDAEKAVLDIAKGILTAEEYQKFEEVYANNDFNEYTNDLFSLSGQSEAEMKANFERLQARIEEYKRLHEQQPTPEERKQTAYDHLVSVLKEGGELDELQKAVDEKEMSPAEREDILTYLAVDNVRDAKRLFKNIMNSIESRPQFNDVNDGVKYWSDQRKALAEEVHKLNASKILIQSRVKDAQSNMKQIQGLMSKATKTSEYATLKKEYDDVVKDLKFNSDRLSDRTNRLIAVSLIAAEAKTMEKQMKAQAETERRAEERAKLKAAHEIMREKAKQVKGQTKALKQAIDRSSDLEFTPLRKWLDKNDFDKAKKHIKTMNNDLKKINDKNQQIIEMANKVVKKQFGKDQALQNLKSLRDTRRPDHSPVAPRIDDLEKAKEILHESDDAFKKIKLAKLEKEVEHLAKHQNDERQKATKLLNSIANSAAKRRVEIDKEIDGVLRSTENGEYQDAKKSGERLAEISDNLEKALDNTYFDKDASGKDVVNFANDLGLNYLFDRDDLKYREVAINDKDNESKDIENEEPEIGNR